MFGIRTLKTTLGFACRVYTTTERFARHNKDAVKTNDCRIGATWARLLPLAMCLFASTAWADCQKDADCKAGRTCMAGSCVSRPRCVVDRDCPGDDVCKKGSCVLDDATRAPTASSQRPALAPETPPPQGPAPVVTPRPAAEPGYVDLHRGSDPEPEISGTGMRKTGYWLAMFGGAFLFDGIIYTAMASNSSDRAFGAFGLAVSVPLLGAGIPLYFVGKNREENSEAELRQWRLRRQASQGFPAGDESGQRTDLGFSSVVTPIAGPQGLGFAWTGRF